MIPGIVGIYDKSSGDLLERCPVARLDEAISDWNKLGYEVSIGPAMQHMMLLKG